MLPDEVYADSAHSSKFKYSHPLNHMQVDDGSLRARLAYDLMAFMEREDCNYHVNPTIGQGYAPDTNDDEIDIMIIDGFYKEAELLIEQQLLSSPDDEKIKFQKAFIQQLKGEYERILEREDQVLATDPKNINAMINKGFALANLNREEEALKLADKALYLDPDNLTVLSNKAYIAKLLNRDKLHKDVLKKAYNVSARQRLEQLEQEEASLLRDFDSEFVRIDTPSAFNEFNRQSGYSSKAVH